MSKFFLERMQRELADLIAQLTPEETQRLDKEVEEITHMDCDRAAATLTKSEFERVAREAFAKMKRRKMSPPDTHELIAYA